jgi:glyceraldehyde-3-phosphate dehydrogenase/erythrose-4-phosphate dehydrogenase
MVIRVPTPNVSIVDLTVQLNQEVGSIVPFWLQFIS